MKPLVLAAALTALWGCAAQPAPECRSLQCELDLAASAIAKTCSSHLFLYPPGKRKLIDAAYKYPYTNHDTFVAMTQMGSRITSPQQWCKAYAAERLRVRFPASARRSVYPS